MSGQNINVLIVGVGGQGVLLASELLSDVFFNAGMDVKKSEVHGMAQRGGVVSSHIRCGEKVFSPLIPAGQADICLAFEQAESKRWAHFLKSDGTMIVDKRKLVPPIALMKGFEYPEDPIETVKKQIKRVIVVNGTEMAEALGNPRVLNILLLGVLSAQLPIQMDIWQAAIEKRVPKGSEKINLQAFDSGRALSEAL